MAPAAYDTIQAHFRDTGRRPSDYDLIVTGDLGSLGKEILLDLFHRDGIEFKNLEDCGVLIYDAQTQDVHCGGSGCGCSAAVLTGFLLNGMKQGRWRRLLFCGTGVKDRSSVSAVLFREVFSRYFDSSREVARFTECEDTASGKEAVHTDGSQYNNYVTGSSH